MSLALTPAVKYPESPGSFAIRHWLLAAWITISGAAGSGGRGSLAGTCSGSAPGRDPATAAGASDRCTV